jgi:hypothetical protein
MAFSNLDAYQEMIMRNARWRTGGGQAWGRKASELARGTAKGSKAFPKWMSGTSRTVKNLGSKYAPGGVRASAGAASTSALSSFLALVAAAKGGWDTGRTLGQTPTLTDPNTTYDQVYQDIFENMLKRKNKQEE